MSDYTTQLRFICEAYANKTNKPQPQSDIDETIRLARPYLFDFNYPIFDTAYKETLESKIMSHFYTREIGLETVGLFKHHLKNKMREIMPYYNQLYESERLKFDPFINTEYSDNRSTISAENRTADSKATNDSTLNASEIGHQDYGSRDLTDSNTRNEDNRTINTEGETTGSKSGVGTVTKTTTTDQTDTHTGTDNFVYDETNGNNNVQTGTDTVFYKGKSKKTDTLTKDGSELQIEYPAHNMSTLTKHSDTPLGDVGGTVNGSQVPTGGSGVVGNSSNYLSDVTEVISNFDRNPATGENAHRKANRNIIRYGKYWEDTSGSSNDPRTDTHVVEEDYTTNNSDNQRKDEQLKNLTTVDTGSKHYTNDETKDLTDQRNATVVETTGTDDSGTDHGTYTESKTDNDTIDNYFSESRNTKTDSNTTNDTIKNERHDSVSNDKEAREGTSDYFGRLFGKTGSETYSEMLNKFRSTFLNIDLDVIHELDGLFMLVW